MGEHNRLYLFVRLNESSDRPIVAILASTYASASALEVQVLTKFVKTHFFLTHRLLLWIFALHPGLEVSNAFVNECFD